MKNVKGKYFVIFTWLVALAGVAGSIVGCGDKNEAKFEAKIVFASDQVPHEKGSAWITVVAEDEWTIEIEYEEENSEEWLSVKPNSGSGVNSAVILSFTENAGDLARKANLILKNNGENNVFVFTQNSEITTPPIFSPPNWAEMPAVETENMGSNVFVARFTSTATGAEVRNFSLLYDTDMKIPYWVAYPMHSQYLGTSGRNEAWGYDPYIDRSLQARLYSGFANYNTLNFARGHMLASADRTGSLNMNQQTFVFTNIVPQKQTGFNSGKWSSLEGWLQTKTKATSGSDTLYVVTGVALKTVGGSEPISYAQDNSGNPVAIPNYFYKVVLRYSNGNYTHAVGFWYEHLVAEWPDYKTAACTVREIEEKTGMNFFANVPQAKQDELETRFSSTDRSFWGLN